MNNMQSDYAISDEIGLKSLQNFNTQSVIARLALSQARGANNGIDN